MSHCQSANPCSNRRKSTHCSWQHNEETSDDIRRSGRHTMRDIGTAKEAMTHRQWMRIWNCPCQRNPETCQSLPIVPKASESLSALSTITYTDFFLETFPPFSYLDPLALYPALGAEGCGLPFNNFSRNAFALFFSAIKLAMNYKLSCFCNTIKLPS